MRLGRLAFILAGIYFVFVGGSAYYNLIFPIRVFHHILVTLLLALWLIGRIRRRQGFPKTPLNWPILGAVVVWVISAASSLDPRMAFENVWFPLTHIVLFFILIDRFQQRKERLVLETTFMVSAVVIFMSGVELASWYFGLGILPGTQTGWIDVIGPGAWLPLQPLRLSLAMNISTLLAGFVAPLVTLTAAWGFTTHRRDYRTAVWTITGILLVILILTSSRGGLLSILTAAGVVGVLRLLQMRRLGKQQAFVRALAGAILFAGILALSIYTILSITQARIETRGDVGRLDMWQSALEITRDHATTGVGPGLFGREFRVYRNPTIVQDKLASAHNAYLNSAAETGLPGIIVSLWLGTAITLAWYRNWKQETWPGRKLRLEAAFAALLGLAVHSLFDVFTITPIVLLSLVLIAYCVTRREANHLPSAVHIQRFYFLAPAAALIAVIGYGLWLFQLDRAQSQYMRSFQEAETAMENLEAAARLDPGLHLYTLQAAYLRGQAEWQSANPDWEAAAQAYREALALEPTWDIGWINLAAIELRQGNPSAALSNLETARKINVHNQASVHWAELAETMDAAPDEALIEAYVGAIEASVFLPAADYWWATDLRRAAVEQYLADQPVDIQYRVYTAHDPTSAYQLITESPATAPEWWTAGEYALTVDHDSAKAALYFSHAIELDPTNGDYYVSRARAVWASDIQTAERDLDIAGLLGTRDESINAVRAAIQTDPEESNRLRANALPPKVTLQEFAAVLYGGRPALFDVFPEMQGIGPGRDRMQPWYDLAEAYLASGENEKAIRVYLSILEYAPDEQEARQRLQHF